MCFTFQEEFEKNEGRVMKYPEKMLYTYLAETVFWSKHVES